MTTAAPALAVAPGALSRPSTGVPGPGGVPKLAEQVDAARAGRAACSDAPPCPCSAPVPPPRRAAAVAAWCASPHLRSPRSLYAARCLRLLSQRIHIPATAARASPPDPWLPCRKVRSRAVCQPGRLPACPPAHGFVKDVNCHVTPLHPFSKGLGFWRKAMKLI